MIELNLTYEESKKILELGYDFSKVCDRFFIKQKDFQGDSESYFFKMNSSSDMFPLNATISPYDEVWYHGLSLNDNLQEVIPIIPKAALEDCLPDYLLKKGCNLFYHVHKFMGELYWVNSRDESLTDDWFSAYEAFIWCHENYPEELKKKFDEVMK